MPERHVNSPQLRLPDKLLERPLRVVFVTQEDPFYIPHFFREFFGLSGGGAAPKPTAVAASRRPKPTGAAHTPAPESGHTPADSPAEILGVMIQEPLGTSGPRALAHRIWSLYGTVGFVRMGFRYALAKVRTRLHRGILGIPLWPKDHSVRWYARRAGVPILSFPAEPATDGRGRAVVNNANGAAFIQWVRSNRIDIIVSISASQIFREAILAAPRIGCINLHNAPLPNYRGMLPNFRQMAAGERESVLTIHAMVRDLDRGDIMLQRGTPIEPGMSLHDLMVRSKVNSAAALREALDLLRTGRAHLAPLPEVEGSYFTWPTRAEAKAFVRAGGRLL